MKEPKKIYCPICKRKIATYGGKTSMPIVRNCARCNKQIIYYPEMGEILTKKIPPRNASGAKTFL